MGSLNTEQDITVTNEAAQRADEAVKNVLEAFGPGEAVIALADRYLGEPIPVQADSVADFDEIRLDDPAEAQRVLDHVEGFALGVEALAQRIVDAILIDDLGVQAILQNTKASLDSTKRTIQLAEAGLLGSDMAARKLQRKQIAALKESLGPLLERLAGGGPVEDPEDLVA